MAVEIRRRTTYPSRPSSKSAIVLSLSSAYVPSPPENLRRRYGVVTTAFLNAGDDVDTFVPSSTHSRSVGFVTPGWYFAPLIDRWASSGLPTQSTTDSRPGSVGVRVGVGIVGCWMSKLIPYS